MSCSDPKGPLTPSRRSLCRSAWGLIAVGAVGGLLSACGFRPLYGRSDETGGSTVDHLRAIRISPLRDRTGQQLHNLLRDRLNPDGQPADPLYSLDVRLNETIQELALRTDETATRADLNIVATYLLYRFGRDEALFEGQSRTVNSFNILQSQFATQTSETDARERSLRELSDDIRAQLAIYFTRAGVR